MASGWATLRDPKPGLSARALATSAALAEVALDVPIPIAEELARAFHEFVRDEPKARANEARQALLLLELGPVLFERRLTTFSRLAKSEREKHLVEVWMHGDSELLRRASIGLLRFFQLVYFDRADVWPSIGYPGPALGTR
ncbi:MAG: hypothetical protein HYV07_08320 [Deltaproteobacteria bacterium]|nr:hypothetical protein [Deltaproteobacteria bacterium]